MIYNRSKIDRFKDWLKHTVYSYEHKIFMASYLSMLLLLSYVLVKVSS